MPVVQRGTSFQATVHFKGERFRRQFPTNAEAESWEAQAKAALLRGELPDMGDGESRAPATLEALRDLTYRLKWANHKAADAALMNANICIRDIGNVSPAKVTTSTVDSLVFKWQDEGKSGATINRRLSALSMMLKVARDRGYITHLPKFERQKETEGRLRFFTREEEAKMVKWFEFVGNQDMAELVVVAIDTGMRQGELLRMRGRDVHGGCIHIPKSKNGHPRSIPMTKRVASLLEARKEKHGDDRLFPLTKNSVRHIWDRMRHHVFPGDEQAVFHTLRHTFVSRLVQKDINLKKVAVLAGHTTVKTTMRYSHLAPGDLSSVVEALELG